MDISYLYWCCFSLFGSWPMAEGRSLSLGDLRRVPGAQRIQRIHSWAAKRNHSLVVQRIQSWAAKRIHSWAVQRIQSWVEKRIQSWAAKRIRSWAVKRIHRWAEMGRCKTAACC